MKNKWLPFVILPNCKIREQKKGTLGWAIRERIGVAIVNPRGVAAGNKSTIIGK
jgi:hypothetical protein